MNEWLGTLLNVIAFAFIGLLVWLYFLPDKPDDDEDDASRSEDAASSAE